MKRFMDLSVGLLCLMLAVAVGYPIGSVTARADVTSIPGIAFVHGGYVLDVNGETWEVTGPNCWQKASWIDPVPVPVEDIVHWSIMNFMTAQGDMWSHAMNVWENCGPWPGGPVGVENESWGGIKARMSGEDG